MTKKTTLHTNPAGIELIIGTKRIVRYSDENNKEWVIELLLRDPAQELADKKEKEYQKKERLKKQE